MAHARWKRWLRRYAVFIPVEMPLICIQCTDEPLCSGRVGEEERCVLTNSVNCTHEIKSVLVCCTLVVFSCYISISPDKVAACLQGCEIESVVFPSIRDSSFDRNTVWRKVKAYRGDSVVYKFLNRCKWATSTSCYLCWALRRFSISTDQQMQKRGNTWHSVRVDQSIVPY